MTRAGAWIAASVLLLAPTLDARADPAAVQRGEYVLRATGGCGCHTSEGGETLAGGRPLETPFGVYYSTNLTPDVETGLGAWSLDDFTRAMTRGEAPDGSHYFPVFPYTAFARMTAQDLSDMWAYLQSLPAVRQPNREHDVSAPYSWRWTMAVWKWLYFDSGPFPDAPEASPEWLRGRYLVEALAHCGECHTPRNALGGPDAALHMAGSAEAPEGELAPNITPDAETGIGEWGAADVIWLLQMGLKPDGDDVQGLMREVIDDGYTYLTRDDLRALATYLQSLPAIHNEVRAADGGD